MPGEKILKPQARLIKTVNVQDEKRSSGKNNLLLCITSAKFNFELGFGIASLFIVDFFTIYYGFNLFKRIINRQKLQHQSVECDAKKEWVKCIIQVSSVL